MLLGTDLTYFPGVAAPNYQLESPCTLVRRWDYVSIRTAIAILTGTRILTQFLG